MSGRGRWLRWWRGFLEGGAGRPPDDAGALPRPVVRRGWRFTSLQFDRVSAQSRMHTLRPDLLCVDYTRTMLGALLLCPRPGMIGMIGLGGGSQAKFCHRFLPASRIEVAEINPQVAALRRTFRVPDDGPRLQVFIEDGARFVRERPGRYDLLLVDGYDHTGIPEALSSQAFYDACRDALTPAGVVACNLYGDDSAQHLARLRRSFGHRLVVVGETRMSNQVVFAWGGGLPEAALRVGRLQAPHLPEPAHRQLETAFARLAAALRRREASAG